MNDWMTGVPWIVLLLCVVLLFVLSDRAKVKQNGEEKETEKRGNRILILFAWLIAGMGIGVLICRVIHQEPIYGIAVGVIPAIVRQFFDTKK